MTKEQLKAKLTELSVPFEEDASKDELETLLEGATPAAPVAPEAPAAPVAPVVPEAPVVAAAPAAPVAAKPGAKPFVRKAHWPEGFVPSGDRIADTKALLDAEPKVQFICPLAPEEKLGAEEIVSINGHKYTIKKGHMVTIPMSVANMLSNKYRVELEVTQRAAAMASPDRAQALS